MSPRFIVRECPAHYLSDLEVVAGILGAIGPAKKLLKKSSLHGLPGMDLEELEEIVGEKHARKLKLVCDFSRRLATSIPEEPLKITSSSQAAKLFMEKLRYKKKEYFYVLLLDTKNCVICSELVSIGTLNNNIVHPREVFGRAIRKKADKVILFHNHPSGDPAPSPQDKEVTHILVSAGKLLGIVVLDHIIIGNGRYFCFSDHGLIIE